MQYKELKSKYEHTLANLGEKQRVVFLMSRMEGMKYSEIAEKLGISVKAVEKRMNGALSTFRQVLKVLFYLIYFSSISESVASIFNNIKTQVL
jgi:RNA polymerase sigma-70 factor (ECF subfamily)